MNIAQSNTVFIVLVSVAVIAVMLYIISRIRKSPFTYPYMMIPIDVTGKRNPDILDQIDEYLINGGFDEIQEHADAVAYWNEKCQEKIQKSRMKKLRQKQYLACIDYKHTYCFRLIRNQTRYKQVNYVRTPYTVAIEITRMFCDYEYLRERDAQLAEIGYACSLSKYEEKNQRKLMTRKLREEIMIRDNYTCQKCGKYMPDEVGLNVDHIIPIKKGGKSVPSNLQVLCDKCNHKKFLTIETPNL